ncbi:MAG: hypothetical protein KBC63_03170 [Candidatus Levybacteria bacterium]|nr:hypothetical protein [Candidatus Levybacteria bacterium]
MNTIKIDTSQGRLTEITLQMNGSSKILRKEREFSGDQNVVELLDTLLRENALTIKDIKAMQFVTGPGSFTGLRVGAAIANAFAFGLQISVNGKDIGEIDIPTY